MAFPIGRASFRVLEPVALIARKSQHKDIIPSIAIQIGPVSHKVFGIPPGLEPLRFINPMGIREAGTGEPPWTIHDIGAAVLIEIPRSGSHLKEGAAGEVTVETTQVAAERTSFNFMVKKGQELVYEWKGGE
jgi:hypothetical protein